MGAGTLEGSLLQDEPKSPMPPLTRCGEPNLHDSLGRPTHADQLATKIKPILQKAGPPMMRLYDLRQTGATVSDGGIAGIYECSEPRRKERPLSLAQCG